MTDPLRLDRPPAAADVPERERDARVEELLLRGLDHYFAGQHELAISVWTRVLFLDRGHTRARAYIERARGAIAERQRESDELLHTGFAALDRGDANTARKLVTSAIERGAPSEEALALLERVNRLELAARPGHVAGGHETQRPTGPQDVEEDRRRSRVVWIAAGVVGGLLVAAGAAWLSAADPSWLAFGEASRPQAIVPPRDEPVPVPAPAEVWLARGRSLYESGRLHDALTALDAIPHGDALRGRADELRATIQRRLLDETPKTPPVTGAQIPRQ
jgi:hypothetical protein